MEAGAPGAAGVKKSLVGVNRDLVHHDQALSVPLNEFPIGVFSNHFARAKCVEVATLDFHFLAIQTGARQTPFRNPGLRFSIHKMFSVAVVDIGQSCKTRGKSFPHILLALKAGAVRLTSPRHLQNAIIREEGHDPIQIMRVKRIAYLYQPGSNIHLRLTRPEHAPLGRLTSCILSQSCHPGVDNAQVRFGSKPDSRECRLFAATFAGMRPITSVTRPGQRGPWAISVQCSLRVRGDVYGRLTLSANALYIGQVVTWAAAKLPH